MSVAEGLGRRLAIMLVSSLACLLSQIDEPINRFRGLSRWIYTEAGSIFGASEVLYDMLNLGQCSGGIYRSLQLTKPCRVDLGLIRV